MDKLRKYEKTVRIILLCLAAVTVLFCILSPGYEETVLDTGSPRDPITQQEATAPTRQQEDMSLKEIINSVITLKDDLKSVLQDLKANRMDSAVTKIDAISGNLRAIRSLVSKSRGIFGRGNGFIPKQLANVQNMLDLADMAIERLLKPAIFQLQEYPFSQLRVGEGINTRWVGHYIDFAESIMPDAEEALALANAIDFSLIDSDGTVAEYLDKANQLLETYHEKKHLIPILKSMLGVEEDRLYLIAVQNSAEIRASGGFPGSVGAARIVDGVLTIEDFQSVYKVLSSNTPAAGKVTGTENRLFHSGLLAPRDADYCPDFVRVAEIWALGYEAKQKESIDGVISMTPCIVQRLLAAANAEIHLFDGTVLTGENATKVLQYDLYFQYFPIGYTAENNETADLLFADAAKQLLKKVTGNVGISQLIDYLKVAKESFSDRTLMLWMQREEEQDMLTELGWHGGLNQDPQQPQAGIYYSCTVASKMGWYLTMDAEMGEPSVNEDGSFTYPITVTFSNAMTQEELDKASKYITGGYGGNIGGSAYFFAPAEGTVSDFSVSNGRKIHTDKYKDLQLGYMLNFNIQPGQEITVTYCVTTAPGVVAPLTLNMTPTVQNYH